MHRWLAVAALGATFLTPPVWGQRRAGVSGGFAGHAGFAAHGPMVRTPMMGNRGSAFASMQRGSMHFRTSFNRPFSSPFFFHHHHHHFFPWQPYFGYGGYYGYPYDNSPWDYGDSSYSNSYQSYPAADTSSLYMQSTQITQNEISRLSDEVERLREDREPRAAPTSAARSEPESQTTELVFRDKRTEEVQNYAIVGQTFWLFSEQRARKIPLVDLDLPATKKANDERGVEFQLPQ
jgi:hypothetical protein